MTGDEYLPLELMIEILLRLPVKSLLRFKCVYFEASLDDDDASASLNLDFLPRGSYLDLTIEGSCRGFIFLKCSSTLYLWNPSTGFHKEIPFSPLRSNLDEEAEFFYGFGYDHSTDDYLLVSMSDDPSHLEFFSFRANTWKEIEGTCFRYVNWNVYEYKPKAGLLFNGAIHWLAFDLNWRYHVIVGFDLIERKLFYMRMPNEFNPEAQDCGLWVFGEFLSVWAMNNDNDTVEIWVMKEYKVHSSWTKTLVLSFDGVPTRYFSPLCCTKSGDIIGTNGYAVLVKYDDNGQLLEHHSYNPRGSLTAMYTESLLSLAGDNEQA